MNDGSKKPGLILEVLSKSQTSLEISRTNSMESVPEDGGGPGGGGGGGRTDSEDEGGGERVGHYVGRRHSSVSSLLEGLTEDEHSRLAKCMEDILDIVGDNFPEPAVKETIVRYVLASVFCT